MPYRTVSIDTLTRGGFTRPASASSYHPPGDQSNHIHLGVPTSSGGQIAPTGSVLVTFISLKRNNNPKAAGRLEPDVNGTFSLKLMKWSEGWNNDNGWERGWKDELRNTLGTMIQP